MKEKGLFLSPVFPSPPDRGQHERVLNLLRAFADVFDVTFIGPVPSGSARRSDVEQVCSNAIYVSATKLDRRYEMLKAAICLQRPSVVATNRAYQEAMLALRMSEFRIIWAERLQLARLCLPYAEKTIVDLDDLEHVKALRAMSAHLFSLAAVKDAYTAARMITREVLQTRRYRGCIVCSENDRKYLLRWGVRNIYVLPNGVDVDSPSIRPRSAPGPSSRLSGVVPSMVFVGNMSYEPNIDAVNHFASDILPLIRKRWPAAILDVIGGAVEEGLRSSLKGKIRFRGYVDDLYGAMAEYDLFVAPIRFGGGTKLKVLSAMAAKISIVTTSVGAEGLELEHLRSAFLADTTEQFADAVIKLVLDPVAAKEMAQRAYAIASEGFNWPRIRAQAADLFATLS